MNFLKESIKILLYSVGYFALIVIVVTILLQFSYTRAFVLMFIEPGAWAWESVSLQILGVIFVIIYAVVRRRKFRKIAMELNATSDPIAQSKIISQNAELIADAKTINDYGKGQAAIMQTKEGRYIYAHLAVISVVSTIAFALHGRILLSDTQLVLYFLFISAHLVIIFIQACVAFMRGTKSLAWILIFEVPMLFFLYLIVGGLVSQ